MSRSSAQKSVAISIPKSKKVEGPAIFDPSIYVTKNLSTEDVSKLKECFDIFDYDKSGSVSGQQLITAIKALGLEKDAAKILQVVSSQTDAEEMDFETFLKIFGFSGDEKSEQSLHQLFEVFDKQKVGSFGVTEFAQICEEVGQRFSMQEIEQMISYADRDGDGRINYEQFVEIVTKQYPSI